MFPILNPPPSSLPIPSLWVVPVHQPHRIDLESIAKIAQFPCILHPVPPDTVVAMGQEGVETEQKEEHIIILWTRLSIEGMGIVAGLGARLESWAEVSD